MTTPKRNLGESEQWGRVTEKEIEELNRRIRALEGAKKITSQGQSILSGLVAKAEVKDQLMQSQLDFQGTVTYSDIPPSSGIDDPGDPDADGEYFPPPDPDGEENTSDPDAIDDPDPIPEPEEDETELSPEHTWVHIDPATGEIQREYRLVDYEWEPITVGTGYIADGAVHKEKIEKAVTDAIDEAVEQSEFAVEAVNGKNTNYTSASEPTEPEGGFTVGDIWFDISTPGETVIKTWNGSAWVDRKLGMDALGDDVTVAIEAGGGNQIFSGPVEPEGPFKEGDTWYDTSVDGATYAWTGEPDNSTTTRTTVEGTVTNLFTNPDMAATSGEVVVWENLVENPSFEYGTEGWSFAAGATGRRTTGPNGRVSGSYSLELESLDGASTNNVQATTTVRNVPEGGFLSVRQSIRRGTTGVFQTVSVGVNWQTDTGSFISSEYGPYSSVYTGPNADPGARFETLLGPAPEGAARALIVYRFRDEDGASPVPAGALVQVDAVHVGEASTPEAASVATATYFDGDTSFDSDLTPKWTGTPGDSTSQLVGQRVANVVTTGDVAVIQSTRWSKSGGTSLRIIQNGPSSGWARVTNMDAATAVVWRYQEDTNLTWYNSGWGGRMGWDKNRSNPAPNVPGEHLLRVTGGPQGSNTTIYLSHHIEDGIGKSVWYDLLTVTDTEGYDGPPFSGATPTDIQGSTIKTWNGEAWKVEALDHESLAVGAVTANTIRANAITSAKIASDAIEARHIQTGTIQAGDGIIGSLDAGVISAGTIDADRIGANTITGDKIVIASVDGDRLKEDSVPGTVIEDGAITTDKIAANAVEATNIAANAITSDKIEANAITGDKIRANAIDGMTITGATIQTSPEAISQIKLDQNSLVVNSSAPGIEIDRWYSVPLRGFSSIDQIKGYVVGTTLENPSVMILNSKGEIYAFRSAGNALADSVTITGGYAYVVHPNGSVWRAVDPFTSFSVWTTARRADKISSHSSGRVYGIHTGDNVVFSYNSSGSVAWTKTHSSPTSIHVTSNRVFVGLTGTTNRVIELDLSGNLIQAFTVNHFGEYLLVQDGVAYISNADDKKVYVEELGSGQVLLTLSQGGDAVPGGLMNYQGNLAIAWRSPTVGSSEGGVSFHSFTDESKEMVHIDSSSGVLTARSARLPGHSSIKSAEMNVIAPPVGGELNIINPLFKSGFNVVNSKAERLNSYQSFQEGSLISVAGGLSGQSLWMRSSSRQENNHARNWIKIGPSAESLMGGDPSPSGKITGANLDTFNRDSGGWIQENDSYATSARNYPVNVGGILKVSRRTDFNEANNTFFTQEYITRETNSRYFIRHYIISSTGSKSWTPWTQIGGPDPSKPFAMASGTVSITASGGIGETTVTFPSGRFTKTPQVFATGNSAVVALQNVQIATPTTTSVRIVMQRSTGTATSVDWLAVQMEE